jgi:hypothetical protein
MTKPPSPIKIVFLLLTFFVMTDKGAASSESTLFETERSALRGAKEAFASTLDVADLKSAVLAAQTLHKSIATHLETFPTLDSMPGDASHEDLTELDEGIKDLKTCGQEEAQTISSAWQRYDEKANNLTQGLSTAQGKEKALKKVRRLYKDCQKCSLRAEQLDHVHKFYHRCLERISTRNEKPWEKFERVHTCLNELSALYWLAETSLVTAKVVDPQKFPYLWEYWHDGEMAAQSRTTLEELGLTNAVAYLNQIYIRFHAP